VSEAILGIRLWDYSDQMLNINGRVSLKHSFFWGVLGVVLVRWIHPMLHTIATKINNNRDN
jgi:uncharacterized membrane protein